MHGRGRVRIRPRARARIRVVASNAASRAWMESVVTKAVGAATTIAPSPGDGVACIFSCT